MKRKVLYVAHNHPSATPGGAETYALELHSAMRGSTMFEPMLLARTGAPHVVRPTVHPGTRLGRVTDDPGQYLFSTDIADFDWLTLANRRKPQYLEPFREFLRTTAPDIVHFQHSLFFGVDFILATRQTLPNARIVYTLHDYMPICHRQGQMVRTRDDELCGEATPRRCHECFPDVSEQSFFLRKRFISSHLARVDRFVAPSRFLLERFVEWGIPRGKICYEDYGRPPIPRAPDHVRAVRKRFGFFGQLTPYKGLTVLLEAMRRLEAEHPAGTPLPHLWIHGTNLEFFPQSYQDKVRALLAATTNLVTMAGRYDRAQLPELMAQIDWVVVPSIWWENSPLVIQEAFSQGRPVICSGIGAMAEKVAHDIDGLHFQVNDAISLAETLQRAATSPELWTRLQSGIRPVHDMPRHVATLERMYAELLGGAPS